MLRLFLFEDQKLRNIDIEVLRYVNKNIMAIIRIAIDIIEDSPEIIEDILPRRYTKRNTENIKNLFYELYEMVESRTLRDNIKLKYDYLLYHIFQWWKEIWDDELLTEPMEDSLKERILKETSYIDEDGENIIYIIITDFDAYYSICFYDLDFLPDFLDTITSIFLKDKEMYNVYFPDVDLDEYMDFMADDLRELYQDMKYKFQKHDDTIAIREQILDEIINCLRLLELRIVELEGRSEVELSNEIFFGLQRVLTVKCNLQTEREATIGRAGKKLGETDLYIYQNDFSHKVDCCIIENKVIEDFTEQYGQLLGYLNPNFDFGVTISINKEKTLEESIQLMKSRLEKIKHDDTIFRLICIEYNNDHGLPYFLSTHILPEDSHRQMKIYHFIFNLFDKERKERARIARHLP